jgi:hypothetical protein
MCVPSAVVAGIVTVKPVAVPLAAVVTVAGDELKIGPLAVSRWKTRSSVAPKPDADPPRRVPGSVGKLWPAVNERLDATVKALLCAARPEVLPIA